MEQTPAASWIKRPHVENAIQKTRRLLNRPSNRPSTKQLLENRAKIVRKNKMRNQLKSQSSEDFKMEAFPSDPKYYSKCIKPMENWEHVWKTVRPGDIIPFVLYMNQDRKIYYAKQKMSEKFSIDMLRIVSAANSQCIDFRPQTVKFNRMLDRYKRPPFKTSESNVDVRAGYMYKNRYLVKSYFTFGQRTVARGTSHVYQTLDIPLLLYVYANKSDDKLKPLIVKDHIFPYEDFHKYITLILLPHGCYKIPEETTYVLFTLQKTEFSLDVVLEPFKMPNDMEWQNPLENPVHAFDSLYDSAVKTPFIADSEREMNDFPSYFSMNSCEEEEGERESDGEPPSPKRLCVEQTTRERDDFELMPPPPPPPPPSSLSPQPAVSTTEESNRQQQITFYMFPQLPVVEKNVLVACPEFVSAYQKLIEKQYGDPKACDFDQNLSNWNPEPLDLSYGSLKGRPEEENLNKLSCADEVDQTMENLSSVESSCSSLKSVEENSIENLEKGEENSIENLDEPNNHDSSTSWNNLQQMPDLNHDEGLLDRIFEGQINDSCQQSDDIDYLLNNDSELDQNRLDELIYDLCASMGTAA